jgi:hypothetical protein
MKNGLYSRSRKKKAVALKKIYLYDKERCQSCEQTPVPLGPSFPVNEEEKNLVRRQLTHGWSSSSIDIIIIEPKLTAANASPC